jgi:large repetitive protein
LAQKMVCRQFITNKKHMKRFLLLALTVIFSVGLAQAQRLDYTRSSNAYLGFSLGSTAHNSDVLNINPGLRAGSIFFGTSIGRTPGNLIGWDLRVRYMGGRWFGQDTDTTSAIGNNAAVNAVYGPQGVAIQNFRTINRSWDLELSMHANRLRENTGIDPYIFGGIGVHNRRSEGNLINTDGLAYDYLNNPTTSQLNSNFDTYLDKDADGASYGETFSTSFAPSLGVGLGFYLTNRLSIGIEHRTTFALDNYFDGTGVNQNGVSSGKNDIFHYTSGYLRWFLPRANGRARNTHQHTQVPPTNPNVYTGTNNMNRLPIVTFTNPSVNAITVNSPTFVLRADVQFVNGAQDVLFRQDGMTNHNFTFNHLTTRFQATVNLVPGQNVFRLRGTNQFGSDEATVIIYYEMGSQLVNTPPVVNITNPGYSPFETTIPSHTIEATILNVSNRNQVNVSFNGVSVTNFNYNQVSSNQALVSFNRNLNVGMNSVVIGAATPNGQHSDQATILYRQQTLVQPPVVSFSNPASSPIMVTNANFNLLGQVLHVDQLNQVTFIQNGTVNQNYTFNLNTKQFSSNVVLQPGQNIFQLIGTNSAGSDQKTVVINYDIPSPKPPIVSIINPATQPYITNNELHNLVATVLNVNSASQVSMKLNGVNFTNFTFNVNTSTLTASIPLLVGSNTIQVKGTNSDGTDMKQTVIVYEKPVTILPPVVEFVNPGVNPYESNVQNLGIIASVLNVDNANQINVNLNGQNITNFNYNSITKMLSFPANLNLGVNTVIVSATNAAGTDAKTQTIIYVDPATKLPPVVTYLDPLMNPMTVYAAGYDVTAKVKHVSGSQDIALTINGISTTNFNFNAASEIMTFTTGLNVGANIIEITATNPYGQDVESTTIVYVKPDPILPPVVTITNPSAQPYTTNQSVKNVTATVLNVSSAQEIMVYLNGTAISNFTFNNATKQLNFSAALVEGNNLVKVVGTNAAGQAQDEKTIVYQPDVVVQPPYVTFVNPSAPGSEVSLPTFQMVAHVIHVEEANGIEVIFNGQVVSPSLYVFNPITKEVVYNVNLNVGNNTFKVKGTNASGSHEASTNIIYKQPITICDKPEINFVVPSSSPFNTEDQVINLKAIIHHVSSANDIVLKVNGQSVGNFLFNATSHELTRQINLNEGNNVIEIEATNSCGKSEKNTIVIYTPATAPCIEPAVALVSPIQTNFTTQDESLTITAAVSNIIAASQILLKVNGITKQFSYDAAAHTISATIPLNLGGNNITIQATNDCGLDRLTLHVVREQCQTPIIQISGVPVNTEGQTISISGTIANASVITLTVNGQQKNFVYDPVSDAFNATVNLNEGNNTIVVQATNNCGQEQKQFSVVYTPKVVVLPPTVTISDPSNSPYNTQNAVKNITAQSTNITTASQVSAMVNGAPVNFNFSAASGTITFPAALNEGNNVVMVTVVNESGTATDSKTIVYTVPVVVLPPIVTFTQPSSNPATLPAGSHNIAGHVDNLDQLSQLEIFVNGQPYSGYTAQVVNGKVNFSLNVNLSVTHPSYEVIAKGTNSAGSDVKTMVVIKEEPAVDTTPNCWPQVGAVFAPNHQSVTTNSTMDLSNVVLQFSDGTTQKFEGLTGLTGTFAGTGQHAGKCITGVWIKSGCNQSGDGPGYGEFVENTGYNGACETQPCDAPTISVTSSADVAQSSYNFQSLITNASANNIELKLNNQVVAFNFNATTGTLSYAATLNEGVNTFYIKVNECEVKESTFNVTYTKPCDPLTYTLVYPNTGTVVVTEPILSNLNLTVNHVTNSGIQVTVNGVNKAFTLSGTSLSVSNITLNEGQNNIQINLSNNCSNQTINYVVSYEPPVAGPCGPRINPGNSDWQFCLVTPSGVYNRNDLHGNPNFTYSGPASSLFFLPIAGGGNAIVNGSEFQIQSGRYYLFEGNLNVNVSSQHPGSMGHWTICITSDNVPQSGNGNNRPVSPCEGGNKSMGSPDGGDGKGNSRGTDGGVNRTEPQPTTNPTQPVRPSGTTVQPSNQPTRPAGTTTRPGGTTAQSSGNSSNETTRPTNTRPAANTSTQNSNQRTTNQSGGDSTVTRPVNVTQPAGVSSPNGGRVAPSGETTQPTRTGGGR